MYKPESFDFPLPILLALAGKDRPRNGAVGVTELVGDHQQSLLRRRHDYYTDPSDSLWMMVGLGFHKAIEETGGSDGKHEMHLVSEVEGLKVEGHVDYVPSASEVVDWKTSSVWATKHVLKNGVEKEKLDWFWQLAFYKALAARNGLKWERGNLTILSKDWRASEAKKERGYPPPLVSIDVNLPSVAVCEATLQARARQWKANAELPDDQLPKCVDLWGKDDNGLPKRCTNYCAVSDFCHQFAAAKNAVRR